MSATGVFRNRESGDESIYLRTRPLNKGGFARSFDQGCLSAEAPCRRLQPFQLIRLGCTSRKILRVTHHPIPTCANRQVLLPLNTYWLCSIYQSNPQEPGHELDSREHGNQRQGVYKDSRMS